MLESNLLGLPSFPTTVREGVLYKNYPVMGGIENPLTKKVITKEKPLFIVEHVHDPSMEGNDIIIAYGLKSGVPEPVKNYREKVYKTTYNNATPLGRLANEIGRKPQRKRVEELPPLYVTPVVPGIDTFTNQPGLGFFEREADSFRADGTVSEGKSTGVFITLDSIKWGRTYVPREEALRELTAIRDVWFNL